MKRHPANPEAIVAAARSWLGTPYLHQGSLRGVGCDCLGLVRGIWRDLLGAEPEDVPPYAADWAEASGRETLAEAALRHLRPVAVEKAAAGDVLLFRWRMHVPAKHCAILTGALAERSSTIIHAHEGCAVSEVALTGWWRRHVSHAFSFPQTR
jgi:NlpC/P60 family putative phage cell wall peptidase